MVYAKRPSDSTLAPWPHTWECLGQGTVSSCPSCLTTRLSSPRGEHLPLAHVQGPEMATAQPRIWGVLGSEWSVPCPHPHPSSHAEVREHNRREEGPWGALPGGAFWESVA